MNAEQYQTLQNKDLESLRSETRNIVADSKTEIIKWMVVLIIPLYLSILAMFITFINKVH